MNSCVSLTDGDYVYGYPIFEKDPFFIQSAHREAGFHDVSFEGAPTESMMSHSLRYSLNPTNVLGLVRKSDVLGIQ